MPQPIHQANLPTKTIDTPTLAALEAPAAEPPTLRHRERGVLPTNQQTEIAPFQELAVLEALAAELSTSTHAQINKPTKPTELPPFQELAALEASAAELLRLVLRCAAAAEAFGHELPLLEALFCVGANKNK